VVLAGAGGPCAGGARSGCLCGCGGAIAGGCDLGAVALELRVPAGREDALDASGQAVRGSGSASAPVRDGGGAFGCGLRALPGAAVVVPGTRLITGLVAVPGPVFPPRPRVPLGVPRGILFGLVVGPGVRAVWDAIGGKSGRWIWFPVPVVRVFPDGAVPGLPGLDGVTVTTAGGAKRTLLVARVISRLGVGGASGRVSVGAVPWIGGTTLDGGASPGVVVVLAVGWSAVWGRGTSSSSPK
jgi:hypothetical protein